MLEHRKRAPDNRRGDDAIENGNSALKPNHFPIVRRRREKVEGPNQTKGQGKQPDRDPDTEAGANQFTALSHLQRERDCGQSADQATDEEGRINSSEQHTTPEAAEDGGEKTMGPAEQDADYERGKGIGNKERPGFGTEKPDGASTGERQDELRCCELNKNNSEDEKQARAAPEDLGLIDPELR